MPAKTKPTPRALAQQQSAAAAKGKTLRDDTDPKGITAGGTTDDARSPVRKSKRIGGSPSPNSQGLARKKRNTGSSPSRAHFAAVEIQAENEVAGLSTGNELHVETTTSVTAISAETEEETRLSTKDNFYSDD